jgi:hypothetical protein
MPDSDQFSVNLAQFCARNAVRLYELLILAGRYFRKEWREAFYAAGFVCCSSTVGICSLTVGTAAGTIP